MIENVSTQLTVFHCLCPLPASRKGLRLPLRSALFGEGGRDWRPCVCKNEKDPFKIESTRVVTTFLPL